LTTRRPQAVLFDFYGTLSQVVRAASRRPIADALGCTLDQLTAALSESFYERAAGRCGDEAASMRWIARRLGVPEDEVVLRQALAARRAVERSNMRLRPEAVPVLTELRRRGLRTAVVSDCTHELVVEWPRLAVAPLVDAAAFSIEVGACKPEPRIYLAAVEAIGVPPVGCLYLGDGGSRELSGARAVGMTAVLLDSDDLGDHVAHRREAGWDGPVVGGLDAILAYCD
jgi:putative hydrolase of the HAD superfamily